MTAVLPFLSLQICVDQHREVRFALAGMEGAPLFRELVEGHYAGLYRFGLSLARRPDVAEDLVQQTFLQWARKGHTLREEGKAKTWLFTTLYREWLNVKRRENRVEVVEFDPELHGGANEEASVQVSAEDGAMVMTALNRLDDNYRAPLILFYMKEMSYKDISQVLDVPMGTVMSRLSRGKDMLRKALQAVLAGESVPAVQVKETRPVNT